MSDHVDNVVSRLRMWTMIQSMDVRCRTLSWLSSDIAALSHARAIRPSHSPIPRCAIVRPIVKYKYQCQRKARPYLYLSGNAAKRTPTYCLSSSRGNKFA